MACEGTMLIFSQGIKSYQNTKSFDIKCSCGRLNRNVQSAVFEDGMNSKVGWKGNYVLINWFKNIGW